MGKSMSPAKHRPECFILCRTVCTTPRGPGAEGLWRGRGQHDPLHEELCRCLDSYRPGKVYSCVVPVLTCDLLRGFQLQFSGPVIVFATSMDGAISSAGPKASTE